MLESLDPRVNRLKLPESFDAPMAAKDELDQFETYQTFVQTKEGKPFEHAGIVHAPNLDMAFLFAKEQFSRRGMFCNALCVAKTELIKTSVFTDNLQDVYDTFEGTYSGDESESFEIFHLLKRGKQHKYIGNALGKNSQDAMLAAKELYPRSKPVYNVWVIRTEDILMSDEEDADIWNTLKEKKYRDAIDYRAADKIKAFKEENR
ncbi:phenylacetic acid degradation b [Roseivirga sp.]|uniref:phenylacetic acid degradation b n=1 Tax=Roseivirga sp. TaxID=1964215 RepID=UPI003B8E7171